MNELILMLNAVRLEIRNLALQTATSGAISSGAVQLKLDGAAHTSTGLQDAADALANRAMSDSAWREEHQGPSA